MKHAAVLRNEVNQVEHFKELESLCGTSGFTLLTEEKSVVYNIVTGFNKQIKF